MLVDPGAGAGSPRGFTVDPRACFQLFQRLKLKCDEPLTNVGCLQRLTPGFSQLTLRLLSPLELKYDEPLSNFAYFGFNGNHSVPLHDGADAAGRA